MSTMAAVHEEMHQGASKKQQEEQIPRIREKMRAMFGDEKEAGDREEADQNQILARERKKPPLPHHSR